MVAPLLGVLMVLGSSVAIAATPTLTPSPSPTPPPSFTANGVYSIASFQSDPANATGALDTTNGSDRASRADIMNLLLNVNASERKLSGSATLGAYAFPTIGYALNQTFQTGANTSLYGALPLIDLNFAPDSHVAFMVGKLATMLGQESGFTYQNFNIERGLAWALEPTVQRGARITYLNGAWSAAIEDDDGFYSGRYGSVTSMLAYSPSAATTISFIAMSPSANARPNPTMPIANKREYDLMFSRQIGKWNLQPYILLVRSPASALLGYARDERASAAVFLGTYSASPRLSFGFRYEALRNASATNDIGPNADLLGYGPGSSARSFTLTPTYRFGTAFVRGEIARVALNAYQPGLGFGALGTNATQTRLGIELGVQP